MLTNTGYDLYVIEETPTPLAALPVQQDTFLPVAVFMFAAVLAVLAAAYYVWRCSCYRRKIAVIRQFGSGADAQQSGWNLFRLKCETEKLEQSLVQTYREGGNPLQRQ